MKRKKGLSAIVTLMILILVTLSTAGIIFVVINKTVTENLENSESCYGIFEKVKINSEYTCYDSSTNETHFSIEVREIEFQKILISILNEDNSTNFELTNEFQTISGLRNFDGSNEVRAPGENSGDTYIASDIFSNPLGIKLALIINGNSCGVSDSLSNIGNC